MHGRRLGAPLVAGDRRWQHQRNVEKTRIHGSHRRCGRKLATIMSRNLSVPTLSQQTGRIHPHRWNLSFFAGRHGLACPLDADT